MSLSDAASRYADDWHSPEALVRLAEKRLAERLKRAGTLCEVCGRPFIPARADALTCSDTCRKKKSRSDS